MGNTSSHIAGTRHPHQRAGVPIEYTGRNIFVPRQTTTPTMDVVVNKVVREGGYMSCICNVCVCVI